MLITYITFASLIVAPLLIAYHAYQYHVNCIKELNKQHETNMEKLENQYRKKVSKLERLIYYTVYTMDSKDSSKTIKVEDTETGEIKHLNHFEQALDNLKYYTKYKR